MLDRHAANFAPHLPLNGSTRLDFAISGRHHSGGDRNIRCIARVGASIEVRVMYQSETQNPRFDPAMLVTLVLGIVTAALLATVL
jgi:hypothetical protein